MRLANASQQMHQYHLYAHYASYATLMSLCTAPLSSLTPQFTQSEYKRKDDLPACLVTFHQPYSISQLRYLPSILLLFAYKYVHLIRVILSPQNSIGLIFNPMLFWGVKIILFRGKCLSIKTCVLNFCMARKVVVVL